MPNVFKYFIVAILLLSSNFAFAQIKPVQIDGPDDLNHSSITVKPNTEFYAAAFKIRVDGEIIATPQTTARVGQEVTISSVAKIPYKINFTLLDYTKFSSKDVFGTHAPDNTTSHMLVEAELFLKDKNSAEAGTWEIVSTPRLLATIDGKTVSSKIDATRVYMKSPVSEGILQNVTVEVDITRTLLNATDLAKARHRSNASKCKPNQNQNDPNMLKSGGGTTPTAPGDGGDDNPNCCTDNCLTCCGASACCQDPWNCPGGGCCT